VSDASPADVVSWFQIEQLRVHNLVVTLEHARFFRHKEETPERKAAFDERLSAIAGRTKEPFLRSTKTGATISVEDALCGLLTSQPQLSTDLAPNDAVGKPIRFHVEYLNDDDHFVVDTSAGAVRVRAIQFRGRLRLVIKEAPLAALKTYTRDGAPGSVISQAAIFPIEVEGRPPFSAELHNIAETGETYVILRLR
jgi:hypothetical protein